MKTVCFSTHDFEKKYLENWGKELGIEVHLLDSRLGLETVSLASGFESISCWSCDDLNAEVLKKLKDMGVQLVSLRSAGFSHVDIDAAKKLGLTVARVPAYSPEAIAEHTLGLLMCLNRKFHKAFQRVKDFNFTLEGLEGLTLRGKTVGIIGVGKIGEAFARIMRGIGCELLLFDTNKDESLAKELNATYVDLNDLFKKSDIVSLHCPLNKQTKHIINQASLDLMKTDSFLLNTGRGGLIETQALIDKLSKKELRGVGLDVYEHEEDVFFHDHSDQGISDEKLLRLMSFPNVVITSHQAFFTKEALNNIAGISLENIANFSKKSAIDPQNLVVSN